MTRKIDTSYGVYNGDVNALRSQEIIALAKAYQWCDHTQPDSERNEERMKTALTALAMAMVEDVEKTYEPVKYQVKATIEKTFTVEADNADDAKRKVAESVRGCGGRLVDSEAKEEGAEE